MRAVVIFAVVVLVRAEQKCYNPMKDSNGFAHYLQDMVNLPITQDSNSNAGISLLSSSESVRFSNAELFTQSNVDNYTDLYKATWLMEVAYDNSTSLIHKTTTIKYLLSVCLGMDIDPPCRYTAPVVCALDSNDTKFKKTGTFVANFNYQLICVPVMTKYLLNTNVSTTSADVINSAYDASVNTDWGTTTGDLTVAISSDFYGQNITNTINNEIRVRVKTVPTVNRCLHDVPRVFLPRELQNLHYGGVTCFELDDKTRFLFHSPTFFNNFKVPCTNITYAIVFKNQVNLLPSLVVAEPPNSFNEPTSSSTKWRTVFGLIPDSQAVNPLLYPATGGGILLQMGVIGQCTNICNNIVAQEDNRIDCDVNCFELLKHVISLDNICDSFTDVNNASTLCTNEICESFAPPSITINISTFTQDALCTAMVYNYGQPDKLDEMKLRPPYDYSALRPGPETNFLDVYVVPTVNALDVGEICKTRLSPISEQDGLGLESASPSGLYVPGACAVEGYLNEQGQISNKLLNMLAMETPDEVRNNAVILPSNNEILGVWAQNLQNVVMSVLQSSALIFLKNHPGKIDETIDMLVRRRPRSSVLHTSMRCIVHVVLLLWFSILNVGSLVTLIQTIIRYNTQLQHAKTLVFPVTIDGATIIVETLQETTYSVKIWPGCLLLVAYLLFLVFAVIVMAYMLYKEDWRTRLRWLKEQGLSNFKDRYVVLGSGEMRNRKFDKGILFPYKRQNANKNMKYEADKSSAASSSHSSTFANSAVIHRARSI